MDLGAEGRQDRPIGPLDYVCRPISTGRQVITTTAREVIASMYFSCMKVNNQSTELANLFLNFLRKSCKGVGSRGIAMRM